MAPNSSGLRLCHNFGRGFLNRIFLIDYLLLLLCKIGHSQRNTFLSCRPTLRFTSQGSQPWTSSLGVCCLFQSGSHQGLRSLGTTTRFPQGQVLIGFLFYFQRSRPAHNSSSPRVLELKGRWFILCQCLISALSGNFVKKQFTIRSDEVAVAEPPPGSDFLSLSDLLSFFFNLNSRNLADFLNQLDQNDQFETEYVHLYT